MKAIIAAQHAYSQWANRRILDAAQQITPEQFDLPTELGHGSLRTTFVHMLQTEAVWRMLARDGDLLHPFPQAEELTTVADVRDGLQAEAEEMRRYLKTLTEGELAESCLLRDPRGDEHTYTRWQMLLHRFTHTHQHRTEIAAMLTEFGHSPGDLDFIFFAEEVGSPV